jgi:CheY-like chemotaxis protein
MLKKILIAEDEKALSNALDIQLKNAGFATQVVPDGQAALEAIKSNEYALILLDLIMPKIDGFKVIERIKSLGREIKIIVLSNLSQQEDIARVKALGLCEFYIKSNTPLTTIIHRVKELTI